MQVRGDQNMLLMPSQEEKLSMELLFFVLLQYLMTPLSTDTAQKSERQTQLKITNIYVKVL